jgi:hypothetical protein
MSATEHEMEILHKAVATVLTSQINHQEEVVTWDAEGNEVSTGEMKYTAAPATMAAAIKFLKDNQITCDIEDNKEMGSLKKALDQKQKRSRLGNAKGAANLSVV